jgi:anti-sigma factor RsiW
MTTACAEREGELALLASEDLDERAASRLRRHLQTCAGCHARLEEYRSGIDWLRSRRHAPATARLGQELQARLQRSLATRRQVPWPFTLVRRLLDALPRLHLPHDRLVGGLAGLLLAVGAVGALQRPLELPAPAAQAPALPSSLAARDGHDDRALELEGDLAAAGEGSEREPGDDADLHDGDEPGDGAETAPAGELATLGPADARLRIEIATKDPNVRIIWFAGAATP